MVYVLTVCEQPVSISCMYCCVYSEKLLMMDRGIVRNTWFYSKNKFEKLVHLVGFIIRIYHDARSPERQSITMHGHPNVNLSRCTVTRTSIYHDARSPERQFITMHGHPNVNFSRCSVTRTSIYHDARSPERQFITMHGQPNVTLPRCTVTRTSIYHDTRSSERQFITMHGHQNVSLSRCRSLERQFITMHGQLNIKYIAQHNSNENEYNEMNMT